MRSIKRFLERHAEVFPEQSGLLPPDPELVLCVVIPALAEREGISEVLRSLGGSPGVEVIVTVNNRADAPRTVQDNNLETIELLKSNPPGDLPVLVLDRASPGRAYPVETAGVGAARRTGMDLALRRLVQTGTCERGAIVCLDADSPVAPGYLDAIKQVFDSKKPPFAGVCRHRHRLPNVEPGSRAIVAYELWLRYIELGFRVCRSPYAFQTIGSCTVASPRGYALADGMPRRQAGEDFYFLQKIVKVGGPKSVVQIPEALVYPSARLSDRVPFGTGRAMTRSAAQGPGAYLYAEPPEAFRDLRSFFILATDRFEKGGQFENTASPGLTAFLEARGAWAVLERLRVNSADGSHFLRSLHTWFDSLQVVRYARACKAKTGGVWLFDALAGLEGRAFVDLPRPDPGNSDFDLQIRWLDRMRDLPRK